MSDLETKRKLTFDELIEYILDKDTGKEIKERFKNGFEDTQFGLKITKSKEKYKIVKSDDFTVTNRLLRYMVYELYKNDVEYAEDPKEYPTFENVALFVAFVNNYVGRHGYLSLILTSTATSGGIAGEFDIAIQGRIMSHINYIGEEELPKNKYEGKYTLIEIDSSEIDIKSGGQCVGGGDCYWFIDYPSPKEKYKKNERLIFEIDGDFILDTTVDELIDRAGQSLGERDDWTIGLDETGLDDDLENNQKSWWETTKYVHIHLFQLNFHETY